MFCASCSLLRWTCTFLLIQHSYSVPTTFPSQLATTDSTAIIRTSSKTRYERGLEDYDEALYGQQRGMIESPQYDDAHEEHHQEKAVQGDPWAKYYEFLINEGSFKFWAVFQLVTALVLVYASFAAVYYAKFNVIAPDYDDGDDVFGRSNAQPPSSLPWFGLSAQTFQRIFEAISSKKYGRSTGK